MSSVLEVASPPDACVPVFVARQAIFDVNLKIYAYELLFRGCANGPAVVENASSATASVIANGLSLVASQLHSRPAFINFPEELLIDGSPLALRPESCVIEILEDVRPSPELLRALRRYKRQGYILALDDYVGQEHLAPLLKLADIVKLDVKQRPIVEIIKLCQKLRAPGRILLAEKVSDRTTFEVAASLGIKYFQGYYFARPVIEQGTTLKTGAITRLRMLGELSTEDYNVKQVAKVISQDPGLSFRLLKHINSPHFGFQGRITSLSQAVTLMGGKPLKQWLMLVMLADMGEGGRHEDLVFTSVCRGNFLERLAALRPLLPFTAETFFLLGLFSNLDALLNQRMEDILCHLPLHESIAAALRGEPNAVRDYLDLRIHLEKGNWDAAERLIQQLKLPKERVAGLVTLATNWTISMLDFDILRNRRTGAPLSLANNN